MDEEIEPPYDYEKDYGMIAIEVIILAILIVLIMRWLI